jgi:uncharacterized protein (TIGR00369 family)
MSRWNAPRKLTPKDFTVRNDRNFALNAKLADAIRESAERHLARGARPGIEQAMPRFEPKNPEYLKIATATFERQQAMRTLGITIVRIEPGEVELSMPYALAWSQQNGFIHAGIVTAALDTACGIAVFTLMPAGTDVLTVEFKTNLLSPAKGERFAFRAGVIKPGRTLTICEARAFAQAGGVETLIATMTGTLMAMFPRG